MARLGVSGGTFYSAARCPGRRFLSVPRYMLWLFVFISVGSILFAPYLAPGVPIARNDLVELLRQLPEPFLLVGDFNIRHPIWGDTVASPNAAMLLPVTLDRLCCLSFGLLTHYHLSTDSFSC